MSDFMNTSHSNSKIVYCHLNQINAADQQQHEEYTVIYRVTDIIVAHVSMFQKIAILRHFLSINQQRTCHRVISVFSYHHR
jgi:hypothetical protein